MGGVSSARHLRVLHLTVDLVTNTLLLARVSGRPLSRHFVPALPPDCVLDCVYSAENAALFVLDVLQWKRQSVAESEAEFR